MITSKFKFLTKEESNALIASIRHERHKLIALLMLDAGLRVSEACTLRLGDFDFKNCLIKVRSLKKRSDVKGVRLVPISNRLYQCLADFIGLIGKLGRNYR